MTSRAVQGLAHSYRPDLSRQSWIETIFDLRINGDRTRNGGSRPNDTRGPNTGLHEGRKISTRVHPSIRLLLAHTPVASHNPNSRTARPRDRLGRPARERRPPREVRQPEAAELQRPVAGAWSRGPRHELA
jgi:hypothetical protein